MKGNNQQHPRLLHAHGDWTISDVGAEIANATYHVYDRAQVPDEDNPFTGLVNRNGLGRRAFGRFKSDVIPRVNSYEDPFTRVVALSREMRRETSWSDEWREVVPLLFLMRMLTPSLLDTAAEQVSALLDSHDDVDEFALAEAVMSALFDVPEPTFPGAEGDDQAAPGVA